MYTKEELKRQMSAGQELVPYALNEKDLKAVEAIMAERYADREWTFGRVKTYDVNRSRRIENCGTVKVSLRLREGNIDAISFAGDFFGSSDLGELESLLTGCGCTKEAVFSILQAADPGRYIHNITAAQLADLITEDI